MRFTLKTMALGICLLSGVAVASAQSVTETITGPAMQSTDAQCAAPIDVQRTQHTIYKEVPGTILQKQVSFTDEALPQRMKRIKHVSFTEVPVTRRVRDVSFTEEALPLEMRRVKHVQLVEVPTCRKVKEINFTEQTVPYIAPALDNCGNPLP